MENEFIDLHAYKSFQDCIIESIPELKEMFQDYYIGIVDADGLESINRVCEMTLKELAHNIFCLKIRASANYQRNAVFYFIRLDVDDYRKIMEKVRTNDFIEAGIIITNILDYRDKSKLTDINQKLAEIKKLRGYL